MQANFHLSWNIYWALSNWETWVEAILPQITPGQSTFLAPSCDVSIQMQFADI